MHEGFDERVETLGARVHAVARFRLQNRLQQLQSAWGLSGRNRSQMKRWETRKSTKRGKAETLRRREVRRMKGREVR